MGDSREYFYLDLRIERVKSLVSLQPISCLFFLLVPGPPPVNIMAPSSAVPNLLDGGGLLNPAPLGVQAPVQMNHQPVASLTPNSSSG